MSHLVVIFYTDEPHLRPTVHSFPTQDLAEAFVIADAQAEWAWMECEEDWPRPVTLDQAREFYDYASSSRRVHLIHEQEIYHYEKED